MKILNALFKLFKKIFIFFVDLKYYILLTGFFV